MPTLPPPESTPTLAVTPTIALPANAIQHLAVGTDVTITTIQMSDLEPDGTAATDPNDHILLTANGGYDLERCNPAGGERHGHWR